jgi:hypothetical protein
METTKTKYNPIMKHLKILLFAIFMAIITLALPGFASGNNGNNGNHGNGNNGNHYGHRCDHRCSPHAHCVTNVVTVVRTNVINRYQSVYLTNYVVVTNVVETSMDDVSVNYTLLKGHVYRFYVNTGHGWEIWGRIPSASNQVVRVSVPGHKVRAFPFTWQLVDFTPGFYRVAVPAELPVESPSLAYVAINHRLLRVIR